MNKKLTGSNCINCIHNSVCCYKQDFLDICKVVSESSVTRQLGSQGMSSKKVTMYDILDKIVIKCKHYYNGEEIRVDSNGITLQSYPTITNPCESRALYKIEFVDEKPATLVTYENFLKEKGESQ